MTRKDEERHVENQEQGPRTSGREMVSLPHTHTHPFRMECAALYDGEMKLVQRCRNLGLCTLSCKHHTSNSSDKKISPLYRILSIIL